jgi:hypothetical protein
MHESAVFWVAIAGVVVLVASVLISVGVAQALANHSDLLANRWFDGGLVVGFVGLLVLGWSLVLFLAHREANREVKRVDTALSASSYTTPAVVTVGPATPSAPAVPLPREYCQLSPKELTRLYAQGGTVLQSKTLVEQYIGQWLEVSGTVDTVVPQNSAVTSVTGKDPDGVTVTFFFNPAQWADRLLGLMVGDRMTAVGRIQDVASNSHLILADGEFSARV